MIYLAEHGETAVDRAGETHGGRNDGLDHRGREQAVRLGMRLKRMAQGKRPAVIYHSDKKRTTQTANIAGRIARIPVVVAPELRPLDAGPLGQGPQVAVARRLKPWFDQSRWPIPGGESVEAWRKQHLGFMQRVAEQAQRRGEPPPLLVTHSNVIGSVEGGLEGARLAMARSPRNGELVKATIPKEKL